MVAVDIVRRLGPQVGDPGAVGRPGRTRREPVLARDPPDGARRRICDVDGVTAELPVAGGAPVGRERDLPPVGRPCRLVIVGAAVRELACLTAAIQVDDPDVGQRPVQPADAFELVAVAADPDDAAPGVLLFGLDLAAGAVGTRRDEGDPAAVGRPRGLRDAPRVIRQAPAGTGCRHLADPELGAAAAVPHEGDVAAVRRPARRAELRAAGGDRPPPRRPVDLEQHEPAPNGIPSLVDGLQHDRGRSPIRRERNLLEADKAGEIVEPDRPPPGFVGHAAQPGAGATMPPG